MHTVIRGAFLGLLATPALLGVLALTSGLGVTGWTVGLASGWMVTAILARARLRGEQEIQPADWVTLTRALLSAGVAGLVADSFDRPLSVAALVVLSSVALLLDNVDGRVARRTGTVTPFGARFDGEVDAFLILVLSVAVAREYGSWVLAIGLARYVFLIAGWVIAWLAVPVPPRYWRKVVAAVQGIVLTVAASGLLPRPIGMIAVGAALVLLAESFGRDAVWQYRTHAGPRTRRAVRLGTTSAAFAVLWIALLAPNRLDRLTPAAFVRVPVEGLAVLAIGLVPRPRVRRVLAIAAGAALGLLTVLKVLDIGFYQQLGRPFDPVSDWGSFGPATGVVRDSIGGPATTVVVVLLGCGIALLVALVISAAVRISAVTARRRRRSAAGIAVAVVIVTVCAALSLQLVPGQSLASSSASALAVGHVERAVAAVRDHEDFDGLLQAADPFAGSPAADLLSGLHGKDVLFVFVESYGQVAVQDTSFSPAVDAVLNQGTATLAQAGFSARSAFLDSPTFGGISWLAHSTLQSGLWVDNQQRYDQLMTSDRFTLSDAFGRAGWRTVSDIPSDTGPWPEGRSFYHYDQLYNGRDVGYRGPKFSYASMPDQYTLAAFQRLELAPGHQPVMAEIDLVSSHTPWTPLPSLVPWDQLGDGSVFDPMPAQGLTPAVAWQNPETVRRLYGQSVQYSLQAITSWVAGLHDDNLVLVVLGDHQPWTTVSGPRADHKVPVSVVAADPAVLDAITSWHWTDGLLPSRTAPAWPMDAFRNRFLEAFSATSTAAALQAPR